jgi:hypothetical protein
MKNVRKPNNHIDLCIKLYTVTLIVGRAFGNEKALRLLRATAGQGRISGVTPDCTPPRNSGDCHNLCVCISAWYELGMEPTFGKDTIGTNC